MVVHVSGHQQHCPEHACSKARRASSLTGSDSVSTWLKPELERQGATAKKIAESRSRRYKESEPRSIDGRSVPSELATSVSARRAIEEAQRVDDVARERALRDRRAAAHFYEHGKGNQATGVRGTLWAAYNGVTEYMDHRKPNSIAHDFSEARLRYVWFGGGAVVKQRALIAALKRATPNV